MHLYDDNEYFLRLINLSNDLISLVSFEGYFLRVNEKWTKLLEKTEDELKQTPIINFVHPDDQKETKKAFKNVLDNKKTGLTFTNRYVSSNGKAYWLEWNCVVDHEKQVILSITREISQKVEDNNKDQAIQNLFFKLNNQISDQSFELQNFIRSALTEIQKIYPKHSFSFWQWDENLEEIRGSQSNPKLNNLNIQLITKKNQSNLYHLLTDLFLEHASFSKDEITIISNNRYLNHFNINTLLVAESGFYFGIRYILCLELRESESWSKKDELNLLMLSSILGNALMYQQQKERSEELENFRLLAQRINDGVVITDANQKVEWVNDSFTKVTGYSLKEVEGKKLGGFLQGEKTNPDHIKAIDKGIAKKEHFTQVILNYHKNGSTYWNELSITPLLNKKDEVVRYYGIQNDITKRKEAEEALLKSEEKYRSVVNALQEGIVVQDMDDRVIMCNQSASRILGLTHDQLLGKSSFDPRWKALDKDGNPLKPVEHPSIATLTTGKPVEKFIMQVDVGNEKRRVININTEPVVDKNGTMYGVVASFLDITEEREAFQKLKKNEHQLKRSLQDKIVLIKEIHHRVKNNLQLVASILSIRKIQSKDESLTQFVNDTINRIHSISELHNQLLAVNEYQFLSIDRYLNIIIKRLHNSHKDLVQNPVTLKMEVADAKLTTDTALHVGLIVNELVTNAYKHAFEKVEEPNLVIRLFEKDKDNILVIKDNGKGMQFADEHWEKSMGLFILKTLTEQISGQLEIKNAEGLEYIITFPKKVNFEYQASDN